MKVDILLIATNKYKHFIPQMLESISKYIKFPHRTVLFTDEITGQADLEFEIEHEVFPYCSLFRYHYFNSVKEDLAGDYLMYVDIDARFNAEVGEEILSDLTAVRHCGFWFKKNLPQETNKQSAFYGYMFEKYYGGGLNLASREMFFKLCDWAIERINRDLDKGILPIHNDETAWNAFLTLNKPTIELSPDFHFPQEVCERKPEWEAARDWFVNNCWNGQVPFEPKLILLKKEHEKIRA